MQAQPAPQTTYIDAIGMRCPQPVLKLSMAAADVPRGGWVEIKGDCPTFEADIREYCARRKKTVLSVRAEGQATVIQIAF